MTLLLQHVLDIVVGKVLKAVTVMKLALIIMTAALMFVMNALRFATLPVLLEIFNLPGQQLLQYVKTIVVHVLEIAGVMKTASKIRTAVLICVITAPFLVVVRSREITPSTIPTLQNYCSGYFRSFFCCYHESNPKICLELTMMYMISCFQMQLH